MEVNSSLKELVLAVRFAFEKTDIKESYIVFNDFPSGSCMDASIILGEIIERKGLGIFECITGEKRLATQENTLITHFWLENDTYIIDITVDQFCKKHTNCYIIEKETEYKHLGFEITNKQSLREIPNHVADWHSAKKKIYMLLNIL